MKLNNPAVSVLMSVYNEPIEWIQEAIDSIIHQTFTDFEFIIVNDNPKRKELATSLVVNAEKDNRITVISNAENIGLTKSLNIGLKHCKGKYIARMDADDISLPQRFEKQYSYMSFHTEIGVCGTFAEMFGQKNAIWKVPVKHEDCAIFYETPFIHPTVFIRKKY